jgi:hypothetical protein
VFKGRGGLVDGPDGTSNKALLAGADNVRKARRYSGIW